MSPRSVPCVQLKNKVLIPVVGFGTWSIADIQPIRQAIQCGYKHIDSAESYRNQHLIGEVLLSSSDEVTTSTDLAYLHPDIINVPLDQFSASFSVPHGTQTSRQIFVTGKVPPSKMSPEGVRETVAKFQKEVNLECVDLMLLHWPGGTRLAPTDPKHRHIRLESWRALETEYSEGRCRSIGVSNYMANHLEDIVEDVLRRQKEGDEKAVVPMVNQIEISFVCQPSSRLIEICQAHCIRLAAYSPLGSHEGFSEMMEMEPISSWPAEKKPHVALRWVLSRGWIVLPRSQSPSHIKANFDAQFGQASKEEMKLFDQFNELSSQEQKHFCWDPRKIA